MTYFDNAATTWPKPPRVEQAVRQAMRRYGANPGRSGHSMAMQTAEKVYDCRAAAGEMFGAPVEQVVFTANCTHALNTAIKGVLKQGDHVIISQLEHNSVLRPVHTLAQRGVVTYSIAPVGRGPDDTLAAIKGLIQPNTRLIACTHGSNVWGIALPIHQIGEMASRMGILFLVDAAQSAGVMPIDMGDCHIDFLCMPGHKSLYGPPGTGLLITPHGDAIDTLMEGGTGSASAMFAQPDGMPERLESGTVNTLGIIGLGAGLAYIRERGVDAICEHEMQIAGDIYGRLAGLPNVQLYTAPPEKGRNLPVVSFNVKGMHSEETVDQLSQKGFALRGGLHCAPLAHEMMGTSDTGAARISVGAFNTREQARRLCDAIRSIAK